MSETFIVASNEAISQGITYWHDSPAILVACYDKLDSVTGGPNGVSESFTKYYAELASTANPRTGVEYTTVDPMKNSSAFTPDNLYYPELIRYIHTSDSIAQFIQTFSTNNLGGAQLAVAVTATRFEELGYSFRLIVNQNETRLILFCQGRGWQYEVQ